MINYKSHQNVHLKSMCEFMGRNGSWHIFNIKIKTLAQCLPIVGPTWKKFIQLA